MLLCCTPPAHRRRPAAHQRRGLQSLSIALRWAVVKASGSCSLAGTCGGLRHKITSQNSVGSLAALPYCTGVSRACKPCRLFI
jgi:hypothetical protein